MGRRVLLILFVLNGLLLPCGCLPIFALLNPFNPMQQAFVAEIRLTNATNEALRITPVGAVGPEGRRIPLSTFKQKSPAFRSAQRGGFVVEPGSTLEFFYDDDDTNLTEIVVADASGRMRQIVTDLDPTSTQYRRPTPNTFTVNNLELLQTVPENVHAAFLQAQQPFHMWPRLLPLLLPWATFFVLLGLWKKHQYPTAWPSARRSLPAQ